MKKLYMLALLLFSITIVYAQNFHANIINYSSSGLDSDSGADLIDFDGDGKLDVLAGFETRKELMVYKNLETTFHIETITDSLVGYFYIRCIDFNQDGFEDALISCNPNSIAYEEGLYAYINDGNYNYTPHLIIPTNYDAVEQVEVVDMDLDGDLDLVIDFYANNSSFLYVKNEGNQTYSTSFINFYGSPVELYGVADLNSDGYPDVLGAYFNFSVNNFIIVAAENDTSLNNFTVHPIDTVTNTYEGVVADFVGDSLPDLIVSPVAYNSTAANVWRNDGNFNFSLVYVATTPTYCRLYMPNDYDGDGDMDALAPGFGNIHLLRNNGNGTFTSVLIAEEDAAQPVAWDDMNGDGLKDILTNARSRNQIYYQQANGTYSLAWANYNGGYDELMIFDYDGNGTNDIISSLGSRINVITQTFDEKRLPAGEYNPAGMTENWEEWGGSIPYDFDQDGDLDLFVGHEQSMYILYNTNGVFSPTVVVPTISSSQLFKQGDLDQDGNPDFIFIAGGYERMEWNGNSFTNTSLPGNSPVYDMMDVDEDGDQELVFLSWNLSQQSYELKYAKNDNNVFTPLVMMNLSGIVATGAGNNNASMEVGDIDDDGDQEIFLLNYLDGSIIMLRNDSMVFTPITISNDIITPEHLRVTDLDNDGDQDILVANVTWGEIYLFTNDGNENFTETMITDQAGAPENIELIDFDKDGDLDFFTNSYGDYKTVWFENLLIDCPRTYAETSETICNGDSLLFGTNYISEQGFYLDTLVNSAGCDSVIRMHLELTIVALTTITENICPADSVWFAGQYVSIEGSYFDSLSSVNGCDSVIQLQLNHYNLPVVNLSQDANVVSAPIGFTSYLWYLNDTLIEGENNSHLDASLYGNGNYAVEISTAEGCLVLSNPLLVSIVGVQEMAYGHLVLTYPNPVSDYVILEARSGQEIQLVEIYTLLGSLIELEQEEIHAANGQIMLNLQSIQPGVFLLKVKVDDGIILKKIIKQ